MKSATATVFEAEDGSRFFQPFEAEVHDALLYIGKSIAAYGHKQVAVVIADLSAVQPEVYNTIKQIAAHLQAVHKTMPVGETTPRIDSANAPESIRGKPDKPGLALPTPSELLEQVRRPDETSRSPEPLPNDNSAQAQTFARPMSMSIPAQRPPAPSPAPAPVTKTA